MYRISVAGSDLRKRTRVLRLPGALTLVFIAWTLSMGAAHAHNPGQSVVFLNIEDHQIDGRIEVALYEINTALGLDFPTDRRATDTDVEARADELRAYFEDRASFGINGDPVPITWTRAELMTIQLGQYAVLHFSLTNLNAPATAIQVSYRAVFDEIPEHRAVLVVENDWKSGTADNEAVAALVFGPGSEQQTVDLSSSSVLRGIAAMASLGTHHIWIGIDHILFLVALLLPSVLRRSEERWVPVEGFKQALMNVVAIVTLFTIAHTITLSMATLQIITIPARLVESVIAASIAIAAFNILKPVLQTHIWTVVFVFGLFHGFGFASALSDLNIPERYLVHSLLGFNLGVELGQLAIVCVVFPLIYLVRGLAVYSTLIVRGAAVLLIGVSGYWFTERAFDIDLPAGSIAKSVLGLAGV